MYLVTATDLALVVDQKQSAVTDQMYYHNNITGIIYYMNFSAVLHIVWCSEPLVRLAHCHVQVLTMILTTTVCCSRSCSCEHLC